MVPLSQRMYGWSDLMEGAKEFFCKCGIRVNDGHLGVPISSRCDMVSSFHIKTKRVPNQSRYEPNNNNILKTKTSMKKLTVKRIGHRWKTHLSFRPPGVEQNESRFKTHHLHRPRRTIMSSARSISNFIARRAMSSATRRAASVGGPADVQQIDARVFCCGSEGGNPVTIFSSSAPLPGSVQRRLAKSCDWESVFVGADAATTNTTPMMAFFMPSGEEVSFCAHAAIGGAIAMGEEPGSWKFATSMTGDSFSVATEAVEEKTNDEDGGYSAEGFPAELKSRRCCLQMKGVRFDEAPLAPTGMVTLKGLSDRLGWSMTTIGSPAAPVPTNASVARPKTLLRLESVDAVQRAGTPPSDMDFAGACALMDDSTGIYLYAPIEDNGSDKNNDNGFLSYECRQFPRSSGYPEDPATGIAAAALAASLRFGGHGGGDGDHRGDGAASPTYNIYQGKAMGRPSLIQVSGLRKEENGTTITFGLQGRVEIDKTSSVQLSD